MTDVRKASDIILALEEKVNTLIKIVSVYDMNIKLILDRVNKVSAYIDRIQAELDQEAAASTDINNATQIHVDADNNIPMSDIPINNIRTSRTEPISDPNVSDDKKVPIIQRITDGTGKDLFMAEITVIDDNSKVILKTKTNTAGKWQAYLKPGNYTVNMIKTNAATKEKLEGKQHINVPSSNTTITLPSAIIRK